MTDPTPSALTPNEPPLFYPSQAREPDWWRSVRRSIINEFGVIQTPPVLAHYTDAHGLYGISTDAKLRATDLRFVNDSKEVHEYLDLCISQLNMYLPDSGDAYVREVPVPVQDFLRRVRDALAAFDRPLYAVSFTEDKDGLGQWRGYCPDGRGYALHFDFQSLANIGGPDGTKTWVLFKCEYNPVKHDIVTDRAIKNIVESYQLSLDQFGEGWPDEFLDLVVSFFMFLATVLKHEAYHEEREWRLVGNIYAAIPEIRVREQGIVPYVSLPLLQEGQEARVSKVVVGPTHDKQIQVKAVEELKLSCPLLWEAKVVPSVVPYRGS